MSRERDNTDEGTRPRDRCEEFRRIEEYLSHFEDRAAGLAALNVGLSIERAHRVGYK